MLVKTIWFILIMSIPFVMNFVCKIVFGDIPSSKTGDIKIFPPKLEKKLRALKELADTRRVEQEDKNRRYRKDDEDVKMRQTKLKKLYKEEEENKLPEDDKKNEDNDKNKKTNDNNNKNDKQFFKSTIDDDKKNINNNVNVIVEKGIDILEQK